MNEKLVLRLAGIMVLVLFIAVVVVNALANILPLNGIPTGELSDSIPNLFVPAGLTFALWGLIYLLLLGYAAAVLGTVFSRTPKSGWTGADGLVFIVNAALNIGWIFAWHWQRVGLSLLIMFAILASLILLSERNWRFFSKAEAPRSRAEALRRFMLRVPILVYLGWICVATIANLTAWLVTIGWQGWGIGPVTWTVLVLIAGLVVCALLLLRRAAVASALVFIWAYAGIIIKRSGVDPDQTMPIIITAVASIAVIALLSLRTWIRSRRTA